VSGSIKNKHPLLYQRLPLCQERTWVTTTPTEPILNHIALNKIKNLKIIS